MQSYIKKDFFSNPKNTLQAKVSSRSDYSVANNSFKFAPIIQAKKALAYTQSTDIHIGKGNKHTLGHEAWHVVQQKQERVSATKSENGQAVNNSTALEHEADLFCTGTNMKNATPVQSYKGIFSSNAPIQGFGGILQFDFTSRRNRDSHYSKHGGEYPGLTNAKEYEKRANDIINSPNVKHRRRGDGSWVHYDPVTNDFVASANKNDNVITMFKPRAGISYYNRQL